MTDLREFMKTFEPGTSGKAKAGRQEMVRTGMELLIKLTDLPVRFNRQPAGKLPVDTMVSKN